METSLKTKRNYVTNILLYIAAIALVYFVSNAQIISSSDPFTPLFENIGAYLLIYSLFFFSIAASSFIEKRYNRYKVNWILLIGILILCLVTFFVMVLSNNTVFLGLDDIEVYIEFTFDQKLYYFLSATLLYSLLYFFIYVLPRRFHYRKQFNLIFYLGYLFLAVVLIYSYATEFNNYISLFSALSGDNPYEYAITSFFMNRNDLAIVITIFIYLSLYLHSSNKKWYWWPLIVFLYLNMLFTLSGILILINSAVILFYLLARFFYSFKKHKSRNIIALSIVLSITILMLISFNILYFINSNFSNVVTNLHELAIADLSMRIGVWSEGLNLLLHNYVYLFFGIGHGVFNELINFTLPGTTSVYSGYIQLLGDGGILLFLVFVLAIAYIVYVQIKMLKIDKSLATLSILMLVGCLVFMAFDDQAIIFSKSPDMIFLTFIVVVPLLSKYYHLQHPIVIKEIELDYLNSKKEKEPFFAGNFTLSRVIYLVLTPFIAIYFGSLYFLGVAYSSISNILYALAIIFAFLFIVAPFLTQLIFNIIRKRKDINYLLFPKKVFLFYFISLLTLSAITFLFFFLLEDTSSLLLLVIPYLTLPIIYWIFVSFFNVSKKYIGFKNIYNALNTFCLTKTYKGIKEENLTFVDTPYKDEPLDDKKTILLISSDDLYRTNMVNELIKRGYRVLLYEELYSNFIHKINSFLPYRANFEFSRIYLDTILYDTLLRKIEYVIVTSGRGLTSDMVFDLRNYHPEATFIYYNPYLMKRYYYSTLLYRSFDKSFTLHKNDAFKYKMTYLNSYYLNEVLECKDVLTTDDFMLTCSYGNYELRILNKILDPLFSKYEKGNVFIKLPPKNKDKFLKKMQKLMPKYYSKITYVPSFFTSSVFKAISKSKYYIDIAGFDDINNLDLINVLLLKKKIITNSTFAKLIEYYSNENIYIFYKEDGINFKDPFFSNDNYVDYKEEILNNNSIDIFIDKLLEASK